MYEGAPFQLEDCSSQNYCYDEILSIIHYTDQAPPLQQDLFGEVHQLIDTWNTYMMANFILSWINCSECQSDIHGLDSCLFLESHGGDII